MFSQIRAKAIRMAITRFIIFTLIAAALMLLGGRWAVDLLVGPINSADTPLEELSGKLVSVDLYYVHDWYAYTERLESGQASGTGKLVDTDYLVERLGVVELFGLRIKESHMDAFSEKYNTFADQFDDPTVTMDDLKVPCPVVVGTLVPMDAENKQFFSEYLEGSGAENFGRYYRLEMNMAHGTPFGLVYVLGGLAAFFFLVGLITLLRAIVGKSAAHVMAYCDTHGGTDAERALEDWYEKSQLIGKLRVGPGFLMTENRMKFRLFPEEEIVWVYQKTTRYNGVPSYELMIGDTNGKLWPVGMREKDIKRVIDFLAVEMPDVALGYHAELAVAFRNNPMSVKDAKKEMESEKPEPGKYQFDEIERKEADRQNETDAIPENVGESLPTPSSQSVEGDSWKELDQ